MTEAAEWLARHTAQAPETLAGRVREYATQAPTDVRLPDALAAAGRTALERVTSHRGDRSVALDLLAADALITLALLAQAEREPAQLGAFAAAALQAGRPGA